jgi:hypothetical protein
MAFDLEGRTSSEEMVALESSFRRRANESADPLRRSFYDSIARTWHELGECRRIREGRSPERPALRLVEGGLDG